MSLEFEPDDSKAPEPETPIPQPPPPTTSRVQSSTRSWRASFATIPPGVWIALGVIGTLLIIITIIATATLVRAIANAPTATPVPTRAVPNLSLLPILAAPGQSVTVSGVNFTPGDRVTVYLRDPAHPSDPILQVARGEIDGSGTFTVGFSYPLDPRWSSLKRVDVIVQSANTGTYWTVALNVQSGGGIITPATPIPGVGTPGGIGTRLPMSTLTPPPQFTPIPLPSATWTPLPPTWTPSATSTPLPPTVTPTPAPATVTPTPAPATVTPTPVITDWRGEYFNNVSLLGAPALVRNDRDINFNWGSGSPDPSLPVDYFSVRWTRTLNFETRLYRFSVQCDDGVRVYVDGNLIIDEWHPATPLVYTRDVSLSAGPHTVTVEYYEGVGNAYIYFQIQTIDTFNGWKGEYFDNPFVGGTPVMVRDDPAVAFDWGAGSPGPGMPAQNWSARWTRTVDLAGGLYRFNFRADDGVRFLVDGVQLINEFHTATGQTYTHDVNLAPGPHTLVVEYYQGTGGAFIWLTYQTPPLEITRWRAEYFANDHWAGFPTLIRNEDRIDFDWGTGSPDPLISADNFSARYTRSYDLPGGEYQFDILVDDGVRFYVDGLLVLDEVKVQAATPYSLRLTLSQGQHDFRIDYVEYTGQARLAWTRTPLSVTVTPAPSPTPLPTAPPSLPTIEVFDVAPTTVQQGGCVNITWRATGSTRFVRLSKNGNILQDNLPFNGTTQDCPNTVGTITYRLEAYNSVNQVTTREIAVTVTAPPTTAPTVAPTVTNTTPVISSFTVTPSSISLGNCFTLLWSTNNATTPISLEVNGQTLQTNLPISGTAQDCPTTSGTKIYSLIIAAGPNNQAVSQTASATVN